jgi:hypothetical protein
MTHEEFATLLKDPTAAAARTGRFACFQGIPREERIRTWRFAGTAENLADAFERCGALFNRVWPRDNPMSGRAILLDMLPRLEVNARPWSSSATPAEFGLPADAKLVLLAEGGAPHDDVATAIFQVKEWSSLLSRPIEDQAPSPNCSAYVLEFYGAMANNSGDQMGVAFAARDLASLRRCLEQFTKDDPSEDGEVFGMLARARFELCTAINLALDGSGLALRVWTVQQGIASEPLDVRPFVRVTTGGQSSTLDTLEEVFEADGAFPSEGVLVEVMWDAIESALQPLVEPLLEEDGELGFENESEETEWFVGPLTLGENLIEP